MQSIYVPFAQNIYDCDNLELIGKEILLRKIDDNKIILPGEFFDNIKNEGTFVKICEESCIMAIQKFSQGPKTSFLFINLSQEQLQSIETISRLLFYIESYDIRRYIIFEILEDYLDLKDSHILYNLKKIHELNICIAIDDFGTGQSSFSRLMVIPHKYVKVDRELFQIKNIHSQNILKHIVEMCHENNKYALAEGIEDLKDLEYVKKLNFDFVQGFLFDKPQKYL